MRAKLEEQPFFVQEIKLSHPHPQPHPRILILKHLPKNVDAEGIRNMIKPATPSSISDANSELSNEQKKVCFVSFQTKEEAFTAFQKRGSWRYSGLVPDVWFAPERRPQLNQQPPSAVSQPPTNREARAFPKIWNPTSDSFDVKIVGLPSSTTEPILASALKDVSIVSLRVLCQLKASGKYAFVAVKTKRDQEALIAMQDTLTIDGHQLTIFQPSDTDLRLEQLPQGTTKEELVSLFPNSKVVRVNLFSQKGKIKADVIFANSASLKEALKRTENLEFRSHQRPKLSPSASPAECAVWDAAGIDVCSSCAVQPALNSFAAFAEQMDVRCSSSRLECGLLLTSPAILADDPVPDQHALLIRRCPHKHNANLNLKFSIVAFPGIRSEPSRDCAPTQKKYPIISLTSPYTIINSISEFRTSCNTNIVANPSGFQGNTLLFVSNGTFIAEDFRFETDKQSHFANVATNSHLSISDAVVLVGSSIQSVLEIDESTVILTSVQLMSNSALLPQISSYSPNGGTLSIIASTISSLISSTQNQLLSHPNLTTTTLVNSVVSNITFQDIPYSPEPSSFSSSLLIHSCDLSDSDRFLYCGFVDLNQPNVGRVNNASLIRTSANADDTNTQSGHQDIDSSQTISNTKASGLTGGCFYLKGDITLTLQTCLFENIKRGSSGTVVFAEKDKSSQAVILKDVICDTCDGTGAGTIWTHLGKIEIEDSEFRSCETKNLGGAIRIDNSANQNYLLVTNTLFSKCGVREGHGGAISAKINGRDKTRIITCIFEYCYCPGNGAALDMWNGLQFLIQNCLFIDNRAGDKNPSDLQIWDTTPDQFNLAEGMIDCLSSSPQPRISFKEFPLTEEETAKYFPVFTVNELIVANNGEDELFCGYDYKAKGDCKTVNYAVQNLKADSSDPFYYISIRNTDTEPIYPVDTSISNQFNKIQVQNYTANALGKISCELLSDYLSTTDSNIHHRFVNLSIHHFTNTLSSVQALFKVDGGKLEVTRCVLDGCQTDTNPEEIKKPFFKVNSGEVTCSELSVTSLTFVGAKLIDTTSYTSLSVTDSKFTSLTSDSTLINLKGSSGTTTFTSTKFTAISASSQPVIDVDITGTVVFAGTTIFEDSPSLSSNLVAASSSSKVQFSGTSFKNVGSASTLFSSAGSASFTFSDSCSFTTCTGSPIFSHASTGTLSISSCTLASLTPTSPSPLFALTGASGTVKLTSAPITGLTLATSPLIEMTGGQAATLSAEEIKSVSSTTSLFTIGATSSMEVKDSSLFESCRVGTLFAITTEGSVSFTATTFKDLTSSAALISITKSVGTVSFSASPFTNCESTSSCLVDATLTGSASLSIPSGNVFTDPTTSNTPISATSSSTAALSISPSFIGGTASLTRSVAVSISSSASLAVASASFKASTTTSAKGKGAKLSTAGQLSVTSSTFENCVAANGGALEVILLSGGTATISAVFTGCSSTGNGGAIVLDLSQLSSVSTSAFSLSGSSFSGSSIESSGKGTDVYIAGASTVTPSFATAQFPSAMTTVSGSGMFTSAQIGAAIVGFMTSGSESSSSSVLYFLFPYSSGTLDVHATGGIDDTKCGNPKLPCETISTGFSNLAGTAKKVNVRTNSEITTPISSAIEATISSDSTRRTITLSVNLAITVTSETLTLNTMDFVTDLASVAGSFVKVTGGSIAVSSCTFTSLISTGSGGALSSTIGASQTETITGSTFTSCSSANGGALEVVLLTGGTATISAVFTGCSSTGNGGAIVLDLSQLSSVSTSAFSLSGSSFSGSSIESSGKGTDVYIACDSAVTPTFATSQFPSAMTTVSGSGMFTSAQIGAAVVGFMASGSEQSSSSVLYFLFPYSSGTLDVHATGGIDDAKCGNPKLPCKTISTGFSNLAGTAKKVNVRTNSEISTPISSAIEATISSDSTRRTITLSVNLAISVTSETLSLNTMDFVTTLASVAGSFVKVTGGSIAVSSCSFTSLNSSGSGGALSSTIGTDETETISGSTFTSCSSATGGALEVVLLTGGTATISAVFTGCSSTGNGGAIVLDLSQLSSVSTSAFSLSGSSFSGSSIESSGKGTDLYIACDSGITPSFATTQFPSAMTTVSGSGMFTSAQIGAAVVGFMASGSEQSSSSVLYFLFPYSSGTLDVHATGGIDDAKCGNPKLPCKTISTGFSNLAGTAKKVNVRTNSEISTPISSAIEATISSDSTRRTITLSVNLAISVTSETLSLNTMDFVTTLASVAGSFVKVTGGSIAVSSCSFTSLNSSGSGGALSSTIGTDETETISGSTFTSCSSATGGALEVVLLTGGTATISAVFTGCSSTGNGGAIVLDLSQLSSVSTSAFSLSGSSFSGSSIESSGKGTDLYIACDSGITPSFATTQFPSAMTTVSGSGMFTSAQLEAAVVGFMASGSEQSSSSVLYFLFPYSSGTLDVHATGGIDDAKCGNAKLPCKTISTGFSNLFGTAKKVNVRTNSEITSPISSAIEATISSDSTRRTITLSVNLAISVTSETLTLNTMDFVTTLASVAGSFVKVTGGSITVSSCSFTSLISTGSGGALSSTIGTGEIETITGSTFTSCSAVDGGALSIKVTDGQLSIASTTFEGCTATSKGGALFVDLSALTASGSYSLSGATFSTTKPNTATVSGGNVFVSAGSKNIVDVLEKGSWNSANILAVPSDSVMATPDPAGTTTTFSFQHFFSTSFPSNTINLGTGGIDYKYCGTASFSCLTIKGAFSQSIKSSLASHTLSVGASGSVGGVDVEIGGVPLVVKGDTAASRLSFNSKIVNNIAQTGKLQFSYLCLDCVAAGTGMIETKAGTVEINTCLVGASASTQITSALLTAGYSGSTTSATLNLISSTFKNIKSNGAPALAVTQKGVVSMSNCVVEAASTMSSSLFSVTSGGQLTINTLSFSSIASSTIPIIQAVSGSTLVLSGPVSSTSAAAQISNAVVDLGSAPLISSSSALTMNAITISNFKSTSPLIVLTPTTEKMTIGKTGTTTHFESIESSSVEGGVFKVTLQNTLTATTKIEFVSVSFSTITAPIAAHGSSIYIDATNSPHFLLSSLALGTGTDGSASAVFVKGELHEIVTSSTFTGTTKDEANLKLMFGVYGGQPLLYPLSIFFKTVTNTVFTDSSSVANDNVCGRAVEFPCTGWTTAASKLASSAVTHSLQVVSSQTISSAQSFTKATTISQVSSSAAKVSVTLSQIDVSVTSYFSSSADLTFSKLTIVLPQALSSLSVDSLITTTAILTIADCDFTQSVATALSSNLINLSPSTKTVISNTAFTSLSFTNKSPISASTGAKQAAISNTDFTTIDRTGGDGGGVSAILTAGHSLTLTSNVFNAVTCSSASAKGGAVFASLDSSATLYIDSCTFKGCVATDTSSGTNSTGGGMRLMLLSSFSGEYSISSPVFLTPTTNNANYGKDLFISSYKLTEEIGTGSILFDTTGDTSKDRFVCAPSDNPSYDPDDNQWIGDFLLGVHRDSTIYLGGDSARDEKECGTLALPCLTLKMAASHLIGSSLKIVVVGDFEFAQTVRVSSLEIAPETSTYTWIALTAPTQWNSGASLLTFAAGSSSLSNINFEISPFSETRTSLISAIAGSLSLTNIEFRAKTQSTILNFGLLSSTSNAVLTIQDSIVKETIFSASPVLVVADQSTLESDTLSFVDITFVSSVSDPVLILLQSDEILSQTPDNLTRLVVSNVQPTAIEGLTSESLCGWNSGVVRIVNREAEITDSSFSSVSSFGALFLDSSEVSLMNCSFTDNTAGHASFPSANRNIHCSSSTLTVTEGDWTAPESLWMKNDDCDVVGDWADRDTYLFVPTLLKVESVELEDESGVEVTVTGTNLQPCNLQIRIELATSTQNESPLVLSHSDASSHIETSIVFSIPYTSFPSSGKYSVAAVFGPSFSLSTTSSLITITLPVPPVEPEPPVDPEPIPDPPAKGTLKTWQLILIIVLSVFAVLVGVFIVILVLCIRRRKQKKVADTIEDQLNEDELELQDLEKKSQNTQSLSDLLPNAPSLITIEETIFEQEYKKSPVNDDQDAISLNLLPSTIGDLC
ncbi:hypothetical protein BLNAU_12786 [Blattamonas nauphoetae]|uniref:RRM domain-containing protein n=1 Tax=Blattamonas nauphoetae TaxID=2049346 RepID=A0ABQ9XNQ5_9EUKA|nr:hypothetical protein BLNAU_12786 [Blattamonas nauphoetae]